MTQSTSTKRRWSTRKKIWVSIGVLVLIGAAVYIYIATEKFAGTKGVKEDFTMNATELMQEFRADNVAANAKYAEKIVIVHGRVSELESPDTASVNIKFIHPETGDYIIFAFQEQYLQEARTVNVGDSIAVKGASSGSSYTSILDAYSIPFQRATLHARYGNGEN